MTDITIPPEALEAGLKSFWNSQAELTSAARFQAACLAMLKAWPGISEIIVGINKGSIILPLTENTNGEG